MKKFLKNLRNATLWLIWTFLFVYIAHNITLFIWNFDILSSKSWKIISNYWNKGGSLKTIQDFVFFSFLLLLPFLYVFGFKKALKINYSAQLISFISRFFDSKIDDPERVVIKGMKTNQQYINDIKNELEALKPEKNKESSLIRTNILKKINEEIKK